LPDGGKKKARQKIKKAKAQAKLGDTRKACAKKKGKSTSKAWRHETSGRQKST
jgi:hypothetical protein